MHTISIPLKFQPIGATLPQFEEQHFGQAIQCVLSEYHCMPQEAEQVTRQVFSKMRAEIPLEKTLKEKVFWQAFHKIARQEIPAQQTTMDKNFGLTKSRFDELVAQLKQGDETLFRHVFLAHFENCCKYLTTNYSATPNDAYDMVMKTMLEFHRRLKTDKINYGNLRFLFTRMASQFYLKWIKREERHTEIGDLDLPDPPVELDEDAFAILDKAWNGLCGDCSGLLQKFYYEKIRLEQIASDLGKSAGAVRKQKQRCIEKLRKLYMQLNPA